MEFILFLSYAFSVCTCIYLIFDFLFSFLKKPGSLTNSLLELIKNRKEK